MRVGDRILCSPAVAIFVRWSKIREKCFCYFCATSNVPFWQSYLISALTLAILVVGVWDGCIFDFGVGVDGILDLFCCGEWCVDCGILDCGCVYVDCVGGA